MTTTWRSAEANRELNRDKQVGRRVDMFGQSRLILDADDSGYVLVEFRGGHLRWVGQDYLS